MATTKKKFLDYDGLSTFWSIITNRFADKDKTITNQETTFVSSDDVNGDDNFGEKTVALVSTLADNTTQVVTKLPLANRKNPGLMTPDHYEIVADLHANIEQMAPFAGLQLANEIGTPYTEEVSLTGRKATVALRYEPVLESGIRKAYISLLDPNYPTKGQWNTKTKEEFEAAMAAAEAEHTTLIGWAQYTNGGVTQYWQWSVPGETGPVNALGKPISHKPISKIDVTDLLRTGLLQNTDVVSKGGKTMLKLDFIVKREDDTDDVQSQYIDVSDLVDIYEAGDGIEIVSRTSDPTATQDGTLDDKPTTTKIQLTYATETKRGGLRTGYKADDNATRHYAVQLVRDGDEDGMAFVCIPWDNHTVEVLSTGKDINDKEYLKIKDLSETVNGEDGSKLHNHKFQIEVADGIKNAEKLARTAAQNIYGDSVTTGEGESAVTVNYINIKKDQLGGSAEKGEGTNWTITLDQTVKDSLKLADSAVQTVEVANVTRDGRSNSQTDDFVLTPTGENEKGLKKYEIALGARTVESLQNADSAIQKINLFGTEIRDVNNNQDVSVSYTEAELTKDIKLGNAIKYNVSEDGTLATLKSEASYEEGKQLVNLPTVQAVKTYVDNVHKTIFDKDLTTGEVVDYVATVVGGLDSEMTADKITDTASGETAQSVFTKVVIKDGKLVAPGKEGGSEVKPLSIDDLVDFRSLTDKEIKTICGIAIE